MAPKPSDAAEMSTKVKPTRTLITWGLDGGSERGLGRTLNEGDTKKAGVTAHSGNAGRSVH